MRIKKCKFAITLKYLKLFEVQCNLLFLSVFGVELDVNKEASWLYAELKSHISFQVSFVAYLKLSDET